MTIERDTTVLGIIEFDSMAIGFKVLDDMVKTAPIRIIDARTFFGKYLVVFTGDVASAEYSFRKGIESGEGHITGRLLLPGVHPEVPASIGRIVEGEYDGTVGIIETGTLTTAVEAADIAAKTGGVQIVEIKVSDGFAGKSYMKMTGSIEDVQAAREAALNKLGSSKDWIADIIIPMPHGDTKLFFLK